MPAAFLNSGTASRIRIFTAAALGWTLLVFMALFEEFLPGVMAGTSVVALAGVFLIILVVSYAVSLPGARIPGVRLVV